MDYMECSDAPAGETQLNGDLFTQWQGTQAIGNFCCDEATTDAFGERGVHAIISALNSTDVSELSFTSMRALKQMLGNSSKLMEVAKADKADEAIADLMGLFPTFNQLNFMGMNLIKSINPDNPAGNPPAAAPAAEASA